MTHILTKKFKIPFKFHNVIVPIFFGCVDKFMEKYDISESEVFKILGLQKLKIKYITKGRGGMSSKYILKVYDNSSPTFQINSKNWMFTRYYREGMYRGNESLLFLDPRSDLANMENVVEIFIEMVGNIQKLSKQDKTFLNNNLSKMAFCDRVKLLERMLEKIKNQNLVWNYVTRIFDPDEVYDIREELEKVGLLEKFNNLYDKFSKKLDSYVLNDVDKIKLKRLADNTRNKYLKGDVNFVFGLLDQNVKERVLWDKRDTFLNYSDILHKMYLKKKFGDISCFAEKNVLIFLDMTKYKYYNDRAKVLMKELITSCEKEKRFICFVIAFAYRRTTSVELQSHANTLIVDRKNNTAELFEPHGQRFIYNHVTNESIQSYYSLLNDFFDGLNYQFIEPSQVCPRRGPQVIYSSSSRLSSEEGYCEAWSLWYMEIRLKYADIPREELMKSIMDIFSNDPDLALGVIRNYAEILIKNLETLSVWV